MKRMRMGSRSKSTRRLLLIAAVITLVVGMVVLAVWPSPPAWLLPPRSMARSASRWAGRNVPVVVTITGLISSVFAVWIQRRWHKRGAIDERRRARHRNLMLKRVLTRWVKGVLEQSLACECGSG